MTVNRHASKDIDFQLDDASSGSLQTLTGLTEVAGLPGPKDHVEATAIGDDGWQHVESLERGEFTLTGWYDTTSDDGLQVVFSGIRAKANYEGSFVFGPEGSASSKEKITGECVMVDLEYSTRLGEIVGARGTFRVAGTIGFGTYT